jgi:hypothetical protein
MYCLIKKLLLPVVCMASIALYAQSKLSQSDEGLLEALVENSPFGTKPEASVTTESLGITLRSAAFVDGEWRFHVAHKNGRTAWLAINEDSQAFACKITAFDQESMSVTLLANGKDFNLSLGGKSQSRSGNVKLNDGIIPSKKTIRTPEERHKRWLHATDEQKLEANRIDNAAKKEGRRLNYNEMKRILEIEDEIKVPEEPKPATPASAKPTEEAAE